MKLRDTAVLAIEALRANKLRSVLTALGVIIGIAAVIVMVSIGSGTQGQLEKLINSLGSNRLEIVGGGGRSGAMRTGGASTPSLTFADIDALRREIPDAQYISGSMRQGGQVVAGDSNWATTFTGVELDFFQINNWQLASGQLPSSRDFSGGTKVALIGETVRRELFGDEDPIGKTIRLARVPFKVVGLLASKGQGGWGQDQDDVIFVPLLTAKRRLIGTDQIAGNFVPQISIGVAEGADMSAVQEQINQLLRQRHKIQPGAQDDFQVRNLAEFISARSETTRLMSVLLAAVATISLIVGGIGIMNIMLVSVTERIKEIGLRMATGATPADIQAQFLAEAITISMLGGVLGILIGIGGALLVSKLTALPVALSMDVIGLAAAFAIATGLFFGFYPARKAARLDPIEALRWE
jgi:putative ABC transport system permease protein